MYEVDIYEPVVYYINYDIDYDWYSYVVYPQPKTEELSNGQLFLDL